MTDHQCIRKSREPSLFMPAIPTLTCLCMAQRNSTSTWQPAGGLVAPVCRDHGHTRQQTYLSISRKSRQIVLPRGCWFRFPEPSRPKMPIEGNRTGTTNQASHCSTTMTTPGHTRKGFRKLLEDGLVESVLGGVMTLLRAVSMDCSLNKISDKLQLVVKTTN